ncbi:MAG: glycosyltransferase family 2 protein [Bacteroidota bacterium]
MYSQDSGIDISIIIVNYNTQELTAACIRSVYREEKENRFEVILVDNCSDSFDSNFFETAFPGIKLILNTVNAGFSRAVNQGLELSVGRYILLLNSDTEFVNDAASRAMKRMEAGTNIGVLSSMLLNPDGSLQHPAGRFPALRAEFMELFRITRKFSKEERALFYLGNEFDHLGEVFCDWVWGTFFFFSRRVLEELGNTLPDRFFMYGEDIDWCWKIGRAGYRILYYPEAKVIHKEGSSLHFNDESVKYFTRKFPNTYLAVQMNKGAVYTWSLYFVKALHLMTLRRKADHRKAWQMLRFLFGRKNYWLNTR